MFHTPFPLLLLLFSPFVIAAALGSGSEAKAEVPEALDFTVMSLDGQQVELKDYLGQVVMIINVASECGLTPQYAQLQALHEKYSDQGLAVLGFPCNQFGGQEPGSAAEIRTFCSKNYGVEFDMFSKIDVNGDGAAGLYKFLKLLETSPEGPGEISWNFEKFLLSRVGRVVARFAPRTRPDDAAVVEAIERELAAQYIAGQSQ